jgi:hypothetical protein
MPSKAVYDAVKARLDAGWSGLPVTYPDTRTETPENASAFLVVEFPTSSSEQLTTGAPGANFWRETGTIRFVINSERGSGIADALGWADDLAALFRGKTFDGVTTWAPSPPVIDDANDRGMYAQISTAVEYWYDLTG